MGDLWRVSTWGTGQTITWHDGLTAGYASYFGLDREHGRAVIVLSNVGNPATTDLGVNLLAGMTSGIRARPAPARARTGYVTR